MISQEENPQGVNIKGVSQKPQLQCPKGNIEISQEKNTIYTQLKSSALVPSVLCSLPTASVVLLGLVAPRWSPLSL